METKEAIQELLEKYFQGETSIEEEKQLRNYFLQPNADESLMRFKPIFIFFELERESSVPKSLEDFEPKGKAQILRNRYLAFAAAAVVVLAISLSWFTRETTEEVPFPTEQELLVAQKYLDLGFSNFNKAYSKAEQLMAKTDLMEAQVNQVSKMGQVYQNNMEQSVHKLQNLNGLQKSRIKLLM
jgi:hypothetical protein